MYALAGHAPVFSGHDHAFFDCFIHVAAARAAAQEADTDSLADDTPSEDDPDAEDAGVVGLEVVKRILGAQVIEEVTVTQEGR